jgi:hypothetical protein
MSKFTKMEAIDYRSAPMMKEWFIDRSQRFWFTADRRLRRVGLNRLAYQTGKVGERSVERQGHRRSGRAWLDKYAD